MKIRDCALAVAMAAGMTCAAGQAAAATYVVNQTLDLTTAQWTGTGVTFGEPFGASGAFTPYTNLDLAAGDTLDWTVTFTGVHDALDFASLASMIVGYSGPSHDVDPIDTTATLELLDAFGSSIASAGPAAGNHLWVGGVFSNADFGGLPADLVVHGFHLVGTIGALPDGADAYTINSPFLFIDGAIGVPEPATWTMMIAGFGLAGALLRRRPQAARFQP